uniref:Ig-like domain-containing protein n=1 Tax=Chrysemys picta bellii TaxID=8478 RepID=A0A8C3HGI0_CHRPI
MHPGPELRLGEPPAPEPHGQAVPTLVGDRLLQRLNDGWTELGWGAGNPSFPRPSISLSPTGITTPGSDVTIRCQGQRRDVRFFLHKAGDLNPQRHMDPAGDGAEFRILTVGRQHAGSYSCSYRPQSQPFVSSLPSDTVELVVAGSKFLKPTIWVSPSRVVALGGNVTIRCEGRQRSMEFFLRKAGHPNQQVRTMPNGTVAEFPITSVVTPPHQRI